MCGEKRGPAGRAVSGRGEISRREYRGGIIFRDAFEFSRVMWGGALLAKMCGEEQWRWMILRCAGLLYGSSGRCQV